MNPKDVQKDFIDFIGNNVQKFPGNSTLKFNICDNLSKLKFGMYTSHKCFEMNDEMANYLQQKPELDIKIELTQCGYAKSTFKKIGFNFANK